MRFIVIGTAGLAGSGKGILSEAAIPLGFKVEVMGDVVREEAIRLGLVPSPRTLGKVMLDLRTKEGPDVIAKRCISKVNITSSPRILIEGLRSLDEVNRFKEEYGVFRVVAVHSSPEARYRRLAERKRRDDPTSWHIFQERDMRELAVGIGNVVALADYHVVNEGSAEDFRGEAEKVLLKVTSDAKGQS